MITTFPLETGWNFEVRLRDNAEMKRFTFIGGEPRTLFCVGMILKEQEKKQKGVYFVEPCGFDGFYYRSLEGVVLSHAKRARDYGVQRIIPTQSYEVLTSAIRALDGDRELMDNFSYVRFNDDSEHGELIEGSVYSFDLLKNAISRGWEVR